MTTRRGFMLFVLIPLMIWLAACRQNSTHECVDDIGCITIGPGKAVKIGVLQALNGGAAPIGAIQLNAIKLAAARHDNRLSGHPIEFLVEDSHCLSEGGSNAARKIVTRPDVAAVLGPTCSAAAAKAAEIVSAEGMVLISGCATAPSLTEENGEKGIHWQKGFFRTMYNGAERGRAAARFVFHELGIARVATLNDGDAYTAGETESFGQMLTMLGGEIVLDETVDKGDAEMRPVLTAVANARAELIFFPVFQQEGRSIVLQAGGVPGLENVKLMSSGSLLVDRFIENVGAAGVGMYFLSSVKPEGKLNTAVVSAYTRAYGQPPGHDAYGYGYDAASLLLHALEKVAIQERDGTLHIGRRALRDALYATTDFEGVTGSLTCNMFGDCGIGRFGIFRLDDPSKGVDGVFSNLIASYAASKRENSKKKGPLFDNQLNR